MTGDSKRTNTQAWYKITKKDGTLGYTRRRTYRYTKRDGTIIFGYKRTRKVIDEQGNIKHVYLPRKPKPKPKPKSTKPKQVKIIKPKSTKPKRRKYKCTKADGTLGFSYSVTRKHEVTLPDGTITYVYKKLPKKRIKIKKNIKRKPYRYKITRKDGTIGTTRKKTFKKIQPDGSILYTHKNPCKKRKKRKVINKKRKPAKYKLTKANGTVVTVSFKTFKLPNADGTITYVKRKPKKIIDDAGNIIYIKTIKPRKRKPGPKRKRKYYTKKKSKASKHLAKTLFLERVRARRKEAGRNQKWVKMLPFEPNEQRWIDYKLENPGFYKLLEHMFRKIVKHTYEEHRQLAQQYQLYDKDSWRVFIINNNLADEYSLTPQQYFGNQFEHQFGFWYLGYPKYITHELAKQIIREHNITTRTQYQKFCETINPTLKNRKFPKGPVNAWLHHWKGWDDFLSPEQPIQYLPYIEAKTYVHSLKLTGGWEGWQRYTQQSDFPSFLPKQPYVYYKYQADVWEGIDKWLGTDIVDQLQHKQQHTGVWVIVRNNHDPLNIFSLLTFTGGKIAAIDHCQKHNLTIQRMYTFEPEYRDVIIDIIKCNSTSFYNNEFVTSNYNQLQYQLDSKLLVERL